MGNSRTKNTKQNIIVSFVFMVMSFGFEFIIRYFIVDILSNEYLGLTSLFTSLLQLLNMAELGFAGAIVFNMYKPLAEGDTETVCALLQYYKRIYRIVGIIVFGVGMICMPFVPRLIKGTWPQGINIYVLYFMHLCNTAVSYFLFAYKTSLLEATQRLSLSRIAYIIALFVQYGLQIIVLKAFRSYYLFTFALIIGTLTRNVVAAILAKKEFPEYVCRGTLKKSTKADVISRVKGLMVCNISGIAYTTFDSIVLSLLLGLSSVAIYNNYILLMNGASKIITAIRSSMQASVGNSVAKETVEKNYQDIQLWQFLFSVIATFISVGMLCLYQPVMIMWMGNDMLLPLIDVILITIWFVVGVVQHAVYLYLSGTGLWWELRWPYISSTISNIVLNLILGKLLGITGVILASLISSFVFGFLWQGSIIFKCFFKRSPKEYFKKQMLYFAAAAAPAAASYYVCQFVSTAGIAGLIIKGIICVVITSILLLAIYCKTKIFNRAMKFARNAFFA